MNHTEYQREWRKRNPNYDKNRYLKNKERIQRQHQKWRLKNRDYQRSRYRIFKEKFIKFLGSKCQKCGYSKCIRALEFHHLNPNEKEGKNEPCKLNFEQKIKSGKIQLLCANCHAEIHCRKERH